MKVYRYTYVYNVLHICCKNLPNNHILYVSVAGYFGMNLVSGVEEATYAFPIVTVGSIGAAGFVYFGTLKYINTNTHFKTLQQQQVGVVVFVWTEYMCGTLWLLFVEIGLWFVGLVVWPQSSFRGYQRTKYI